MLRGVFSKNRNRKGQERGYCPRENHPESDCRHHQLLTRVQPGKEISSCAPLPFSGNLFVDLLMSKLEVLTSWLSARLMCGYLRFFFFIFTFNPLSFSFFLFLSSSIFLFFFFFSLLQLGAVSDFKMPLFPL